MLRDKPLAAGSGRQPLTAPLEDRHLHHGRLGAQIVDDRREALVDFGGDARGRSMCTLLEHDGQQLPRARRGRARRSNQLTSTADGTRNA